MYRKLVKCVMAGARGDCLFEDRYCLLRRCGETYRLLRRCGETYRLLRRCGETGGFLVCLKIEMSRSEACCSVSSICEIALFMDQ